MRFAHAPGPLLVLITLAAPLPAQAQAAAATPAPQEETSKSPAPVVTDGSEGANTGVEDATAPSRNDDEPMVRGKPKVSDAVIIEPGAAPRDGPLQLRYSSLNLVRVNPLGLITNNLIGGRYRLYASDNALLKDNYIGLGIAPTVSGGFIRGGILAELQPVSVMRLWARFDALYFYGIFNIFQSFADPAADFSDSRLGELGSLDVGDPKRNYSTWGTQVTLGLDLKIKLGPVAARSLTRLVQSSFNMRTGDRVYFDQFYDVLAPNNGFIFTNDTDLLGYLDLSFLDLLQGMRLVGGLRNTVTAPIYTDSHFAPDNPDRTSSNLLRRTFGANGPIWRVGPLVAFTLFDHPKALFNKPTVLLAAQWHILHRWRTGADVSRFVPYAFLGFAFSGDFLG